MRRAILAIAIAFAPLYLSAADLGYQPRSLNPSAGYTEFSLPKAAKAPVMDGVVSPGEWDDAFAINAMADQTTHWTLLFPRWVKWRLMWDEDNIYLCSESQRLPKENLVISCRDKTVGGTTVMDDSIETHFTPVGRNSVGTTLPWSAQAILNPLGVGFYSKFTWSVAARSTAWVPDWKTGSKIYPDRWVMEVTVPRSSLDLSQPNRTGDPWTFLLARNWKLTGWHQSSLPAQLTSFGVPQEHIFGYLTDSAYAQLDDVSGLFAGDVHTDLRIGDCGSTPQKVTIKLLVQQMGPENTIGATVFEKHENVTVQPGRQIAWTVREPKKLSPDKKYRYYLEAVGADPNKPLLKLNFLVRPGSDKWLAEAAEKMTAAPYSFRARLAPTTCTLLANADFLFSPDPTKVKTLSVTVAPKGQKEPLFTGKCSTVHYNGISTRFQMPKLAPGQYDWTMSLLDASGKEVTRGAGTIERMDEAKAFPWYNFAGGRTDKVLWPYEPIRVDNGGAKIGYWGGGYYLNGLCLPRQVSITANREWRPALLEERPSILSREVSVSAVQDGKPAEIKMQGFPRTLDVKDHKAAMRGYGQIGNSVEMQSDAEFTQDGFLWVTLTLRPAVDASSGRDVRLTEATLDGLTIDIPLTESVAQYMVAHGVPGYGAYTIGVVPQGDGVVWDCTKAGRSALAYGDTLPIVWMGSEQRGLLFTVENNRGWVHKGTPDQQIIRRNGEVLLRLNVVQDSLKLTGDHSIRFGFAPTPTRKMTPGWRMLNCSFDQNFADWASTGRSLGTGALETSSYFPVSYQKSRILMFNTTQNMIYRSVEFAPHTEHAMYDSRTTDYTARGYFGPEWDSSTYTRDYQDHLLFAMQKWMDQGGLTGIYHDQFFPYSMSNSIGGAAYVLPDGRTNPGYNVSLDRQFTMREYALMLENGIQPRIFCHTTNSGQIYAYPWATAILDGEDNMVISNADYDFVDLYPPARMQAYGNPWPWGNTFYWMRLIQEGDAGWRKKQDRAYFGWTYLHDVWNNNGGEAAIWPKLLDWGMNDRDVKYWPYWRTRKVVHVSDEKVLVSMWTLPDRALLCLFNTSKVPTEDVNVRIPCVDLGVMPALRSEYVRAYDMETAENAAYDGWNGSLTAAVGGHDYRMIVIRRYKD